MIVVSGCTTFSFGGQSSQEQPVELVIENKADIEQTFEVSVIQRPGPVKIFYEDGRIGNQTVKEGISQTVPNEDENVSIKRVELPSSARSYDNFRVEGGQRINDNISNLPSNFAIVVVVYQNKNRIISVVTANCGGAVLKGLRVTGDPNPEEGIYTAYSCE
ncbi:hypothetical protein [Haloarchaeobius sp. DFWS5]|uniref:hypothetical protein n=1 Tax=Haloarchaeobius sp. DFWS5 TaxID=3446114 RepID=UPI003EBD6189